MNIYEFLESHGIPYQKCEHPPFFTCDDAKGTPLDLPGTHTKNLFLRDKKGKYFLVTVGFEKSVDLKALGEMLGVKSLGFGSPEKLKEYLGVEPGSVTLLGLAIDTQHLLQFIVDESIWKSDVVQCHPLVNTATVAISHADFEKFLNITGHAPTVLTIPVRS